MMKMESSMTNAGTYARKVPHVCDGTTFIIGGHLKKDARGFTVDLRTSSDTSQFDVALHLNVHYTHHGGVVACNTLTKGTWGVEEREEMPFPVRQGDALECIILITDTEMKIAFNGQHYCNFAHRVSKESIREVVVMGDIDVMNMTVYGPGLTMENSYGGILDQSSSSYQPPAIVGSHHLPGSYHPGQTPVKQFIQGGLYTGRQIYITGTPGHTTFVVNLRCQNSRGNIVFHFVPHMQKRIVIRNSVLNGSFGVEECLQPSFPFVPGYPFYVIIRCEPDKFKVAVNNVHFIDFHHRDFNLVSVEWIEVLGDVHNISLSTPPEPVYL